MGLAGCRPRRDGLEAPVLCKVLVPLPVRTQHQMTAGSSITWRTRLARVSRVLSRPFRSSSVFMERELTLDGAVVSASFDSGMDMGVVGTTAGTLWYISWTEGTSTRLISGHRSKVSLLGC